MPKYGFTHIAIFYPKRSPIYNVTRYFYSKTSQDGHPSGNAKVAVLQRWPSYGNLHSSAIESENISRGVPRGVQGNKQ